MVRGHWADGPRPSSGQSVKHNRTTKRAPQNAGGPYPICELSVSNLCHANGPRPPGGRSDLHADSPAPLHGRSDKPLEAKL
jgi:hypothetical protein